MYTYKMIICSFLCVTSTTVLAMQMTPEFRDALVFGDANQVRHFVEQMHAPINQADGYGFTPLMLATANNNLNVMLYLLQQGALIDFQDPEEHWTALMFAAASDLVVAVDILARHGAWLDAQDIEGWTALMIAAGSGSEGAVRYLIGAHAQRDVVNSGNQTAYDIALESGHQAIANLLSQRNG